MFGDERLKGAPFALPVWYGPVGELRSGRVERMAAFMVDGSFAFKLYKGAWHTSAFPQDECATFMVLDRENTLEEDYDLRDLAATLGVVVEIRQ